MPFCQKCGAQVNKDDKFCQICGARLEKAGTKIGWRVLLWISLVIGVVVAFHEITWIGESSLALVIIPMGIAITLLALYQLVRK